MTQLSRLEKLFTEHRCDGFKWVDPDAVILRQWGRMKRRFGCKGSV